MFITSVTLSCLNKNLIKYSKQITIKISLFLLIFRTILNSTKFLYYTDKQIRFVTGLENNIPCLKIRHLFHNGGEQTSLISFSNKPARGPRAHMCYDRIYAFYIMDTV